MRIRTIRLFNLGPFARRELDFGEQPLALIHGPNESGKSTLLQGLRECLFGFSNATYSHGGELAAEVEAVMADGRKLNYRRRRSSKLASVQGRISGGADAIDAAGLSRLLGDIDASTYRSLFGFSLEELADGGQCLQNASLTEALLGGSQAHSINWVAIRQRIEESRERLYKERGSKQVIPELLRKISDSRSRWELSVVRPAFYQELKSQKNSIEESLQILAQAAQEMEKRVATEQATLEEIPAARQWSELENRIRNAPFPSSATRAWTQQWHVLDQQIQSWRTCCQNDEDQRNKLRSEWEALAKLRPLQPGTEMSLTSLPDRVAWESKVHGLMQQATDIDQCLDRSGALERRLQELEDQSKQTLATLPPELHSSIGSVPALTREQRIDFHTCVHAWTKARAEWELLSQEAGTLEQTGRAIQQRLETLPSLDRWLPVANRISDLEKALQQLLHADEKRNRFSQEMASPTEWKERLGDFLDWDHLTNRLDDLPSLASLSPWIQPWDELQSCKAKLEQELETAQASLAAVAGQLSQLQSESDHSSLEQLTIARARRDALWSEWEQTDTDAVDPRQPLFRTHRNQLLRQLREAIQQTDECVDRLLEDAQRLAEVQSLQRQKDDVHLRIGDIRSRQALLGKSQEDLLRRWHELWRPAGIQPESPEAMKAWLEHVREWRHQQTCQQSLEQAYDVARDVLVELLIKTDPAGHALQEQRTFFETQSADDLRRAVANRQCESQNLERLSWNREECHTRLIAHNKSVDVHRQKKSQVQSRIEELENRIKAWLVERQIPIELRPQEALSWLDALLEWQRSRSERERCQGELGQIRSRIQAFQRDATELLHRAMPGCKIASGSSCVQGLRELEKAIQVDKRHQDLLRALETQIEETERTWRQHQLQLKQAIDQQTQLEQGIGVSPEMARSLADGAEAHWADIDRLASLQKTLERPGSGVDFEQRLNWLLQQDPEDLANRMQASSNELQSLAERRSETLKELGAIEQRMKALGEQASDQGLMEIESLHSELDDAADQWMVLSMAQFLLDTTLESFRKQDQQSVLGEVRRLFGLLTGDRYVDVQPDQLLKNEYVVIDEHGQRKRPKELSTGTREQLYLAIRMAFLADYCLRHEPLPIVMDDCFVNFDDTRLFHTMLALEELGKRSQIILMTCHRRTIEAMERAIPGARILALESADTAVGGRVAPQLGT
jgi:uncharacterized protein YhaN